jgi:hypothetical protein
MSTKKITMMLCILLVIFLGNTGFRAQEKTVDVVTASVNCTSLGTLNGVVKYSYDVTLQSNTSDKLKVKYTVYFMAGNVIKKTHDHSTILIPKDNVTVTNSGSMNESDWDLITECKIEWTATKL